MDPIIHTLIATALLAVAYYIGRLLGIRKGWRVGKIEGAQELLYILDDEGSYKHDNLIAAIARWNDKQLEDRGNDYE